MSCLVFLDSPILVVVNFKRSIKRAAVESKVAWCRNLRLAIVVHEQKVEA